MNRKMTKTVAIVIAVLLVIAMVVPTLLTALIK